MLAPIPILAAPGPAISTASGSCIATPFSAAYYFNGDGSGRSGCLRFFPPCQANELVPGLAVGHVAPQAGLLVLFPASVDHAVLENGDPDDSRFSLSLDLVLTAPQAHEGMAATAGGPPEYLAPHPADWQPLTL